MKKYLKLFIQFRKFPLMRHLEYRMNFFFWSFVASVWGLFNFLFFGLIINISGGVGGWNENEMYLLLATYTIMDAFIWSFFYHNMKAYSQLVFSGELSKLLLKPVDAQYMLMTQDNSYSNIFRLFLGIAVLIYSVNKLGLHPNLIQITTYILFLTISLLMIYFLWFILSTFSFWVEKLDNINEIIPSIKNIYQMPHTIYTGIISTIFTVITPFALAASVPSQILFGVFDVQLLFRLTFFLILFIIISRLFFNFSIKRYSSIGG